MQLFSITAIKPLRGRERVHSATTYLVTAETPEQAKELFEQEENDNGVRFCYVSTARAVGNIQSQAHHTYTPAQVSKFLGEQEPEKKAKERKISSRQLGETQIAVMRSLKEHGGWPKGWIWDTESGTQRICESLYMRCLADKQDTGGRIPLYTLSALGEEELARVS